MSKAVLRVKTLFEQSGMSPEEFVKSGDCPVARATFYNYKRLWEAEKETDIIDEPEEVEVGNDLETSEDILQNRIEEASQTLSNAQIQAPEDEVYTPEPRHVEPISPSPRVPKPTLYILLGGIGVLGISILLWRWWQDQQKNRKLEVVTHEPIHRAYRPEATRFPIYGI